MVDSLHCPAFLGGAPRGSDMEERGEARDRQGASGIHGAREGRGRVWKVQDEALPAACRHTLRATVGGIDHRAGSRNEVPPEPRRVPAHMRG